MKEMNKWQMKAAKENAKLVASGELTRIASRAINSARATMIKGGHTCDGRSMMNSDGAIEREIGRQLDGFKIAGADWALSELRTAAGEIGKIGRGCPESVVEIERLNAVEKELGLVD